jgi:transcriptional regulator with XRE-family HTH domain
MSDEPTRPTAAELRLLLNISQPYASQLANGRRVPSLEKAQQIERLTGYPASAWKKETV